MLLAIAVICFIVGVFGFIGFCWLRLIKFVFANAKAKTATENNQACSDSCDSEFESALKSEVNDFMTKRTQKRRNKTKHVPVDGGLTKG
ncbi:MAG: hypothetical protein AAB649_06020 [Patescibacteria group bacterium]